MSDNYLFLSNTDSQYLNTHLIARGAMSQEERADYGMPERIKESFWIAFWWYIELLRNDRPIYFWGGVSCLAYSISIALIYIYQQITYLFH